MSLSLWRERPSLIGPKGGLTGSKNWNPMFFSLFNPYICDFPPSVFAGLIAVSYSLFFFFFFFFNYYYYYFLFLFYYYYYYYLIYFAFRYIRYISGCDSGAYVCCASFECECMMTRIMFALCMPVCLAADALVVAARCCWNIQVTHCGGCVCQRVKKNNNNNNHISVMYCALFRIFQLSFCLAHLLNFIYFLMWHFCYTEHVYFIYIYRLCFFV